MKNIFHLVSDKQWGGIEQYVFDLASALKKNNYVEIVSSKSDSVIDKFRPLEVAISILPLKGYRDLDSPVRFARLIKKNKNIVHVHTFKDAATAFVARHISENEKTKIVLTRHFIKKAKKGFFFNLMYKEIDKIIFVSELAKEEFLSSHPHINPDKLVVVHDSVKTDTTPDTTPDLRATYRIPQEKKILMFHGRICKEKGIEVLLKAVSQLERDKFHLFIIGEGEQRYVSRLKAFIIANQLLMNVTFLGFQSHVQHYIKQCDIGVLPSVAREPFGLTNLEYMMNGKPHIATNNGAQKEYIENRKTGILVPPEDFHILAAELENLIENQELCNNIGKAAKEEFDKNLSYDNFYENINGIYDSLLNE